MWHDMTDGIQCQVTVTFLFPKLINSNWRQIWLFRAFRVVLVQCLSSLDQLVIIHRYRTSYTIGEAPPIEYYPSVCLSLLARTSQNSCTRFLSYVKSWYLSTKSPYTLHFPDSKWGLSSHDSWNLQSSLKSSIMSIVSWKFRHTKPASVVLTDMEYILLF